MNGLRCSLIIPSHNRRDLLAKLLEALTRQTIGAEAFEVLAVLDGSTDGSDATLAHWQAEGRLPHLRWFAQPQAGQAAARNAGARAARSPILVFLDDDIVPSPGLLEAHLRWYRDRTPVTVLGPSPVVRTEHPTFYDTALWAWWEDVYHERSQFDRMPTYRDFCAGNVSLRRSDFLQVRGFDPAFRDYGGEDYDLGYRLQRLGVRFIMEPEGWGEHHHASSPAVMLRHMRQEGRHDVFFGRKHPELRRGLRLMTHMAGARLVFAAPHLVGAVGAILLGVLHIVERLRWRSRWLRLFGRLRHLAYWRGVVDALGSWAAYQAYGEAAPPVPRCRLDVTDGMPDDLSGFWAHGPCEITVTAAGRTIGTFRLTPPLLGLSRRDLADRILWHLEPGLWASFTEQGCAPWNGRSCPPTASVVKKVSGG